MRVHERVCQAQGPTGAKVLLRALHKLKSSQDVGGGGRGGQRSLPGLVLQDFASCRKKSGLHLAAMDRHTTTKLWLPVSISFAWLHPKHSDLRAFARAGAPGTVVQAGHRQHRVSHARCRHYRFIPIVSGQVAVNGLEEKASF